jgi:hypothetical protein
MKTLLFALIGLAILSSANATIIIRNKNMDEGYSMHVTYRSCHFVNGDLFCNSPTEILIAKGSDYVDNSATVGVIDSVILTNDLTHEVKASSSYLQSSFDKTDINVTACNILTNTDDKKSFPVIPLISLDDMASPYIICKSKYNFNFKREKS